jgi:hypothetical protein
MLFHLSSVSRSTGAPTRPSLRPISKKERDEAAASTIRHFPQLLDYYIKLKESTGDEARDISSEKVTETEQVFEKQVRELQAQLAQHTAFYGTGSSSYEIAQASGVFEGRNRKQRRP